MSGLQGSDPNQPWQQPGPVADQSSEPAMTAGSPWQHQQPIPENAWQAPAYTPQYQQPAEQPYPPAAPGYGQPPQFGAPPQFGHPGQYGQHPQQPGQYGPPPHYGQPGQYPYDQVGSGSKHSLAVIGGVVGVIAVVFIGAILVLGFWQPGFLVTTKLDINKANVGVQQILTDETNGYGAKNVKDVKCNNGSNPTVKKGASFDCAVSIDGVSKHVTVTFQDNRGTYEVGRPQ